MRCPSGGLISESSLILCCVYILLPTECPTDSRCRLVPPSLWCVESADATTWCEGGPPGWRGREDCALMPSWGNHTCLDAASLPPSCRVPSLDPPPPPLQCSFCIVPFTRGRERSRRAASVWEEVAQLADAGVKGAHVALRTARLEPSACFHPLLKSPSHPFRLAAARNHAARPKRQLLRVSPQRGRARSGAAGGRWPCRRLRRR